MRLRLLLSTLVLFLTTVSAQAGLIVTVSDLKINPGETGSIDVLIRSDSGDTLDMFGAVVQISGGAGLSFIDPPGDTQLGDPNYIFAGDNAGGIGKIQLDGTYFGGDGTLSGNGVLVPTLSDALLLRLDVAADASLKSGTTFSVNLVTSDPSTFFVTPVTFDSIPYSAVVAGTVTVIPEPSTLFVLGASVIGLYGVKRRRQQSAA